jgi:hypothetical protein
MLPRVEPGGIYSATCCSTSGFEAKPDERNFGPGVRWGLEPYGRVVRFVMAFVVLTQLWEVLCFSWPLRVASSRVQR